MAPKKKNEIIRNETIIPQSFEDVMHNAMMPYAEYVVMERALPRVEDGLKPVQRRILYTMLELANTPDKPHKKSARIAGDTMGKYHPHGDTSIYDALVRMAQSFSMRDPLVDGHGNFGSVDGDAPAAMRYTEVRLTPLAMELLRDIEKDTVPFSFNFDDTLKEPDMLPGRFPNLLVNGSVGIAVGLATNIPTHNLGEVIDATVAFIDEPDIGVESLLTLLPGPDFPTGGTIVGRGGLQEAYETGRGRITLRSKCAVEKMAGGKSQIVIHEIPFQNNKARMLEEIHKLCENRKGILTGVAEIRDESDREGMRAVIELKKDVDAEKVLHYLYQYSDLQINYSINMVAIADGKPQQLGLPAMLRYYVDHLLTVITRRTKFDLEKAQAREHILEGLMIAISNIDEVIAIIKSSPSVPEANKRLMARFELTAVQSQAILDMRLQRLTALEVDRLKAELKEVRKLIRELKAILASKTKLRQVAKDELQAIRAAYATPRRTRILEDEHVKTFNADDFVVLEDIVVTVTREGYVKRINQKTYNRSDRTVFPDDLGPQDYVTAVLPGTTGCTLYVFTGNGFMVQLPATDLPEVRWAGRGVHLSTLVKGFSAGTPVAGAFLTAKWPMDKTLLFVTKSGMAKRTRSDQYETRNKKYVACGLKDGDELIDVSICRRGLSLTLFTQKGLALQMSTAQAPEMGRPAQGVKAITLNKDDTVIQALHCDDEGEFLLLTDKGYGKRILAMDLSQKPRGGKGAPVFAFSPKGVNGSRLRYAAWVKEPVEVVILQRSGMLTRLSSEEFFIERTNGAGKPMAPVLLGDDIVKVFVHLM